MFGILQWYVWRGPKWLVVLEWNLQRATARYFSAGVMVRTLVAHWHRDKVSYKQGTISKIVLAFAWNIISRFIGFLVRGTMLVLYAIAALAVLLIGCIAVGLFYLWPIIALVMLWFSLQGIAGV